MKYCIINHEDKIELEHTGPFKKEIEIILRNCLQLATVYPDDLERREKILISGEHPIDLTRIKRVG